MNGYDDINPSTPARHDNVDIGQRTPRAVKTTLLTVGPTGTGLPELVISSAAPVDADGRANGTLYIQTA